MSEMVARMDDLGRPAWIAAMVLGFIVFFPAGLAILAFLIWSGRMGCSRHDEFRRARWDDKMNRWSEKFGAWGGSDSSRSRTSGFRPSGNAAFDEYREETLRRLEEEGREFTSFLTRLRMAKDKAEFEQFMSERRANPERPADGGAQPANG